MQAGRPARSRYAEDALRSALVRGVRQLVVLGAGLDSVGEVFRTYWETEPLLARLRGLGYRQIEDLSPVAIVALDRTLSFNRAHLSHVPLAACDPPRSQPILSVELPHTTGVAATSPATPFSDSPTSFRSLSRTGP